MSRYHTTWEILCQIVMCLGIFIMACHRPGDQRDDLSMYYFPIDSFPPEGMVYTYKNLGDTIADPEIWRHIRKSKGLLESINYGSAIEVVQRQYDRIASNGVITDSLMLYFNDSLGVPKQIAVHIISSNRFPFQPGDSSKVWLMKMEWWQPGDSLHVVLERRRRFIGHTTWLSNGQSIPAVRFKTEDTFETERDGWTTSSWTGEEVYALNIGLVYYRRKISEQLSLEFELEEIRSKSKRSEDPAK